MNDYKERYIEYCKQARGIPIFSMPWWMDVLCGEDGWDAYVSGKGNDIKATCAYSIKNSEYGSKITRALLTQNNGIIIKYPKGQGYISRQKYEEKVLDEILDYIENLGLISYDQQFPYKFTNWLPFFWRRYKQTVKYTYVISHQDSMDDIRASYSPDVRNLIRKAEKYGIIVSDCEDLAEFYRVNKLSFDRQGIDIPYSYETFVNLYNACQEHNCVKLLQASDAEGNTHSVAMLVWDDENLYFLLNGTDPDLKSSQSNYKLIDACIEYCMSIGLDFDFEGSVIRQVNHAFREFGGIMMPYFRITKDYR